MADAFTRLLDSIETTGNQDDRLSPHDLYAAYRQHAREAGEPAISSGVFHQRIVHSMAARGIRPRRSDSRRFHGIRIKHDPRERSAEDRNHETDKADEEQRHAHDIENHAEDGWCAGIAKFLRRHTPSRIKVDTLSIWMVFHLAEPEQQKAETDQLENLIAAPNRSGRDGCARDGEGNVPVSRIVDAVHTVLPYTRVEVHLSEPSYVRKQIVPTDGRPCTMEAFLPALLQEVEDNGLLRSAIRAWLKGEFSVALAPLEAETRAQLAGSGIIRFRAVSRITGETLAEGAGNHNALETFTHRWSADANVTVEIDDETGRKGGDA